MTLTCPQLTSIHISSNQLDFSLPDNCHDLKSIQLTYIDLTKWHYLISTHLNWPKGASAYINSPQNLSSIVPGVTSAWWAGKFARWTCSHDPATRLSNTCNVFKTIINEIKHQLERTQHWNRNEIETKDNIKTSNQRETIQAQHQTSMKQPKKTSNKRETTKENIKPAWNNNRQQFKDNINPASVEAKTNNVKSF